MGVAADSGRSKVVDLYNSASGTWSTAQLSVARRFLAATSVRNVTIFAGGNAGDFGGNCGFTLFVEGLLVWVDAFGRRDGVMVAWLRRRACCLLCLLCFAVQEVAVSWGSLQVVESPMLWTCTTVHRAHGRLRSSVWRACFLLRRLLETWPYSRGVL